MAKNEHSARLDRFLDALLELGLDGAVLDRREDCYYFTGYTGSDAAAVFSTRSRRGWLMTDSRYLEEAEKTAPGVETVLWKGAFGKSLGGLLRRLRLKGIGYTPNSMTAAMYAAMKGSAPGVSRWEDADPVVAALRSVKSRTEIAAVRASLDCMQGAFLAAKTRWRVGMTEMEVRTDLEWEMRRRGAADAAFETIVAVGPNASLPHAHAGTRKIRAGKMILVDFGALVNRYCSDLTRTLWAGSVPKMWEKRYRAVLEAQRAGMEAIRAGVPGRAPHERAVEAFRRHGVADRFTHSLGHGVGLAVHEGPRLSSLALRPLEAGNIVTVEPGVYFPGSGGIRVEDMVLVGKDGVEVLSSLPRDVDSLVF